MISARRTRSRPRSSSVSILAGCTPAASQSPSPVTVSSPTRPPAATSAAPMPSATPLSSQPVAVDAGPLGWIKVGEVKAVAWTACSRWMAVIWAGWLEGYPVAWFSSDGLAWTHADPRQGSHAAVPVGWPAPTERCSRERRTGRRPSSSVVNTHRAPRPAALWQAAAWVTTDGTSWQRAGGFAAAIDGNAWAHDVWVTPNGWEAAVEGPNTITIWQSADGLSWTIDGGGHERDGFRRSGGTLPSPTGPVCWSIYDNASRSG